MVIQNANSSRLNAVTSGWRSISLLTVLRVSWELLHWNSRWLLLFYTRQIWYLLLCIRPHIGHGAPIRFSQRLLISITWWSPPSRSSAWVCSQDDNILGVQPSITCPTRCTYVDGARCRAGVTPDSSFSLAYNMLLNVMHTHYRGWREVAWTLFWVFMHMNMYSTRVHTHIWRY
jgi:hypothetical protein